MICSGRLELTPAVHSQLMVHLLPTKPKAEEAAFIFCQSAADKDGIRFSVLETYRAPVTDFVYRSFLGLELSDACRATVIKRAHDLNASLIELHSHPLDQRTEFSFSDRSGFTDFVPHVWWRLKGRPYGAIVVGQSGFDSLCWFSNPTKPDAVLELHIGDRRIFPTGLTLSSWENGYGSQV
jgi:hypothetical protein